ncbi:hypothetical protein P8452_76104 [Trifolium repens]|nr:hypothetical protein P8452_76104 [Trifolium repens]
MSCLLQSKLLIINKNNIATQQNLKLSTTMIWVNKWMHEGAKRKKTNQCNNCSQYTRKDDGKNANKSTITIFLDLF